MSKRRKRFTSTDAMTAGKWAPIKPRKSVGSFHQKRKNSVTSTFAGLSQSTISGRATDRFRWRQWWAASQPNDTNISLSPLSIPLPSVSRFQACLYLSLFNLLQITLIFLFFNYENRHQLCRCSYLAHSSRFKYAVYFKETVAIGLLCVKKKSHFYLS